MFSIVPMQALPNHSFGCVVPIDGGNTSLRFRLMYNELAGYWVVNISRNGETLLAGLPMVPAQDILEQFKYLEIGSAWIVPRSRVAEEWPSYGTLSSDWYVVWGDTDA